MERKQFLSKGIAALGMVAIVPLADSCKKDQAVSSSSGSGGTNSGSGGSSSSCVVTPVETEGPFPTKTPSSFVRSDIRDDRTGVAFTMKITIVNTNNSCAVLSGALVDIWHCDKDGYYSEYGGTSMQSVDYTAVNFLRGRQTTDSNGLVTFTSIFPGWYSGRATHVHVHIYNASGTSLLVTQIAFPEGSSSAVSTVNGSGGTAYGYTKGMTGYTYNASDNIFSDDTTGSEVATVSGSLSGGYVLTHTIRVNA
ncbi:MAG: intradiol ring-cleavage dioxygenase [Bacteroidetes bacterium]|nr:intradiol ring-cleavage dioxygenase [Bacteroidota bacterium]